MNKMLKEMDQVMAGWTQEEQELASKNRFAYFYAKAYTYLQTGPVIYRKQDAFGFPPENWDNEDFEIIARGCRQILEGTGFSFEKPFTRLGVGGFYGLFRLFHFEKTGRETTNCGSKKFIDKMIMKHMVDGSEVTWFNLVEY